ncbi:hypothetical protein HPP92_013144 [Vanilla planifolia]|uniref:Bifunctional inhibitor/plant lipid transfer protein/seed storage helical domain-containing protein n=1 Tax=Vanilla planifolia TaxID=51239 RepID=A0A835QNS1_VANPL|nr:hypothetical protein HPP92_013607 [Vanilla planifolia]KAG0478425.1 hypothetical protein HPP92_013144 [Vanilla planifolia]
MNTRIPQLSTSLHLALLLLLVTAVTTEAADDAEQRCATEAQKLTECVGYASGQDSAPTGDCCGSVTDLKGKDPTCLCIVIRRAHDGGSGGLSGFHLRLDRLLNLPKACTLANASVAFCPKLLNLPPNSPDYAIFTNASYANSSSTGQSTNDSSAGDVTKQSFYGAFLVAASAMFMFFQIRA